MRAIFERWSTSTRIHLPALSIAMAALSTSACGNAVDEPGRVPVEVPTQGASANTSSVDPNSVDPNTVEANDTPPSTACVEGTTMSCRIQLPTQGTTQNCFVGVRTCVSGSFSLCHDPSEPPPSSGH